MAAPSPRFLTNSWRNSDLEKRIQWRNATTGAASTDADLDVDSRAGVCAIPQLVVVDAVAERVDHWVANACQRILGAYPLTSEIVSNAAHQRVDASVYTGYAGIAYFFMEMHLKRDQLKAKLAQDQSTGSLLALARQSVHMALRNTCVWRDQCLVLYAATNNSNVSLAPCRVHLRKRKHEARDSRQKRSAFGGFLCTDTGPLVLATIIYFLDGEVHHAQVLLKTLLNHLPLEDTSDGYPSELLYGRAGLLYGLLKIASCAPALLNQNEETVKKRFYHAVRVFLERILNEGRSNRDLVQQTAFGKGVMSHKLHDMLFPNALMWTWHDKPYLGGAHGVAGIVTVLCLVFFGAGTWRSGLDGQSHSVDLLDSRLAAVQIMDTVEWVLATGRSPNGNFLTRLGSKSDELVHFCHGAPGMVLMLVQVLEASLTWIPHHGSSEWNLDLGSIKRFRDKVWQHVVDALDQYVWPKGLLRKGVGLCHGVGGNGFVFLSVERYLYHEQQVLQRTGEHEVRALCVYESAQQYEQKRKELFGQAVGFLETVLQVDQLTQEHQLGVPDHPFSLMEGSAGGALFCMEMVQNERGGGFPCLNDL